MLKRFLEAVHYWGMKINYFFVRKEKSLLFNITCKTSNFFLVSLKCTCLKPQNSHIYSEELATYQSIVCKETKANQTMSNCSNAAITNLWKLCLSKAILLYIGSCWYLEPMSYLTFNKSKRKGLFWLTASGAAVLGHMTPFPWACVDTEHPSRSTM